MNTTNYDLPVIVINTSPPTCNKDIQAPNTLEKGKRRKTSTKEKSMDNPEPKRKKSIPKNVYIVTNNEGKSKEVIAKAMADMYKRMMYPI